MTQSSISSSSQAPSGPARREGGLPMPAIPPRAPGSPAPTPAPRGGRRPGAGRPPAYAEPLLRKTVALPRSYVEQLEGVGAGNLSEGIRLLVEFAHTRDAAPWFRPIPERQPSPPPAPAPERS